MALGWAVVALIWLLTLAPGTARADDPLVLSGADFSTLHLRPAAERAGTASDQLESGLSGSTRKLLHDATVEASAATARGRQWRSDAFLVRSASVGERVLAAWKRHHRAGSVKLGAGGAVFEQRSRRRVTVEVLWREGSRLGLIALSATRGLATARADALDNAVAADAYLKMALPTTAWGKLLAQVRPNGSVSEQTALEALVLSYGPLPGVSAPSGAKTEGVSGDLAEQWVAPYLSRLKGKLMRAVYRMLGIALPSSKAHLAGYGDPGFTPDAALTTEANHWKLLYALPTYLGHYLRLTIVAGKTTSVETNPHTGGASPADAQSVNAAGDTEPDGPYCRIRVTPAGQAYSAADLDHVLAHEVFHCEQFDFDPGLKSLGAWITEGMAEWAAETLAPVPGYLGVLNGYVTSPATPLFSRAYDGEGFWGHIQQTELNLWHTVETILAQPSAEAQYNAAGGQSANFLTTWGSSVFNDSKFGADWSITSPAKPSATVKPNIVPGSGSVLAVPYTTSQYTIEATEPLERVSISPPNDALLGEGVNRTNLTGILFCAAGSSAACQCPPHDEGVVPPSELLRFPAALGVSGDPKGGTSGTVTAIPLSTYCRPKPTPTPPAPGTNGGTGGDPHMLDFAGGVFDFQQAGEYTLLKTTRGDFDIQVRQQPLSNCCVSFNTAAAMRVGAHGVVEVDRQGASKISVYVNKRSLHGSSANLGGGAKLSVGSVPPFGPEATVTWPDGTTAKVFNAGGLGSGVLDVSVALGKDLAGRVEGLLGNADVPAAKEFPGANSRFYPPSVITGSSRHDISMRYDQFGKSWRIAQRESLFRYARGKSTRSYDVAGFPSTYETVASLPKAKREAAEKACKAAGITSGPLLDACELDVAATGDKGFAAGDAHLRAAVANAPGWSKLSDISSPSLLAPSLGQGDGKVFAAYDYDRNADLQVTTFPDVSGAPSGVAHTDPIVGWSQLDRPLLVPTADGGQQLMVSGNHSSVASDSLNGLDVLQYEPNGTFGPPTSIDASSVEAGATDPGAAVLASNGRTLIWTTNLFLNVWNDSAYPPASQNPTYPSGVVFEGTTNATVAYDTSGRLWLAWYGLPLSSAGTGVYLEQLDPATGAPEPGATPQLAPDSTAEANSDAMKLACNSICHVVYQPGSSKNEIVSWAPGQAAPVTVLDVTAPHAFSDLLGAAAAPNGQIWIVYLYAVSSSEQVIARLGNNDGVGGASTVLSPPMPGGVAYDGAALSTPKGLVVAVNFATSLKTTDAVLWGTVLPQP